jgi:hypothetical protein
MNEIKEAEKAIENRLEKAGFKASMAYDPQGVIESERWWYIPCRFVGSIGCIVSKSDLYVNWLGSALPLDDCIWGHDNGVYHDLVDFHFFPETSQELAGKVLLKFKHMLPRSDGVCPAEPVWYRECEIGDALKAMFPDFPRHFAWYALPELRQAWEQQGLRFYSDLAI